MNESLSIETLIEDQKSLISKWQKELGKNLNIYVPASKVAVETLLIHCQALENLEKLSNSSKVARDV